MTTTESIKRLLTHPATAASVIVSALGSVGVIPFDLLGLVANTSAFWFPAAATTGA